MAGMANSLQNFLIWQSIVRGALFLQGAFFYTIYKWKLHLQAHK